MRWPRASRTVPPSSAPRARSRRTSRTDVSPGARDGRHVELARPRQVARLLDLELPVPGLERAELPPAGLVASSPRRSRRAGRSPSIGHARERRADGVVEQHAFDRAAERERELRRARRWSTRPRRARRAGTSGCSMCTRTWPGGSMSIENVPSAAATARASVGRAVDDVEVSAGDRRRRSRRRACRRAIASATSSTRSSRCSAAVRPSRRRELEPATSLDVAVRRRAQLDRAGDRAEPVHAVGVGEALDRRADVGLRRELGADHRRAVLIADLADQERPGGDARCRRR